MNHFERILARLDGVAGQGPKRSARCPAHDDSNASLSVSLAENGRVRLKCHAGCSLFDIWRELGIEPCELEPDPDEEAMPVLNNQDGHPDPPAGTTKDTSPEHLELWDRVYRAMLALLPLTEEHRENLRKRGLRDEFINDGGYRSISFFWRQSVLRKLRRTIPRGGASESRRFRA